MPAKQVIMAKSTRYQVQNFKTNLTKIYTLELVIPVYYHKNSKGKQ